MADETAILNRQEADMPDEDPDDVLLEWAEYLRRALCARWAGPDRDGGPPLAETREMLDTALVWAQAVVARRPRTGELVWRVRSSLF